MNLDNIDQDMLIHYEFEKNILDTSGNGNDGILTGTLDYFDGVVGNSTYFDGTNDFIDTGIVFQPAGSFSISVWFRYDTQDGNSRMILGNNLYGTNIEANRGIEFGPVYSSGAYIFRCSAISSPNLWISADLSNSYADNQWHMATMVFTSGSSLACYIDGVLGNSVPTSLTKINAASSNLQVANAGEQTNEAPATFKYYSGYLDDLRIYNSSISTDDINTLYSLATTSSTTTTTSSTISSNSTTSNPTTSSNSTVSSPTSSSSSTTSSNSPNISDSTSNQSNSTVNTSIQLSLNFINTPYALLLPISVIYYKRKMSN